MPPPMKTSKWSEKMNKKIDAMSFYRKFILKDKPKFLPRYIYYWFIENCLEEVK